MAGLGFDEGQEAVIEKICVRVIKTLASEGYLMTRDRYDAGQEKQEREHREELKTAIEASALLAAEKVLAAARVAERVGHRPTRLQRIVDNTVPSIVASLATAAIFWVLFIYRSHPTGP